MKHFFRIFAIFMVCALCLPVFVACSGQGSTELKGIKFTQSVYEVDRDTPTELSYKIYPSTANHNNVRFAFAGQEELDYINKFSFKDGKITLTDECGDITATVISGNYSDECIVRLKDYPTEFEFEKANYLINRGGAINLVLKGLLSGVMSSLNANEYSLELESSNQSVIGAQNNLNVYSTGKTGKAVITAYVKNASGKYKTAAGSKNEFETNKKHADVIFAQTTVTVVDNVETAYLNIDGKDSFITLSNHKDMTTDNTITTNASSLKFSILLFSKDGYYIDTDDIELTIISNNPSYIDIESNDDGYVLVDGKYQLKIKDEGSGEYVRIEIHTNLIDQSGNPIEYKFYLAKLS